MNDQALYRLIEAAERTGLTVEAIRQRIKRSRLEAVKGNDGLLRVRLTTAHLESIGNRMATGHSAPTATGQLADNDRLIRALQATAEAQGEAAALRDRAEKAEDEREAARAEAVAERARVAQAEREREAAKVASPSAEGEAKGLRLALEEA